MHRELSRALKVPHWGIFSGRDVPMGLRTCGYRIGLRPLGGACPLRPLRLLRLSVTAAASCSSPRWCTETAVPSKTSNKKYPAASCEVFCGAPSGTRTQDPLIKSQLLSLVARTHGALSSIHNCSSIGFLNSTIHPIT